MSEINVISQTQHIVVDPASSSVSAVNAGPMGPAGPVGLTGDTGPVGPEGPALTPNVYTIASSGTINLDMLVVNGSYLTTPTLTGNVTFTTSNREAGKSVSVRIVNGATLRTLTFPSWVWVGSSAPSNIATNKTGILTLTFFGTADTNAVASWAVQL